MIQIEKITGDLAQSLCQTITKDLPEYFGLPEANEHYAIGVTTRTNFAAKMRITLSVSFRLIFLTLITPISIGWL